MLLASSAIPSIAKGMRLLTDGFVFAGRVAISFRVKLNAEPTPGVGTVKADVEGGRVLEAGGTEEDEEDQL